jgi:putative redox protein
MIEVEIRQTGAASSEATMRGHRVTVDRPVEKGGSDQGAMGGELFLAAVGGCFMSNLLAAGRAREAGLANTQVTVAGTVEGTPARFVAIGLSVSGEAADLDKLVEIADRGCIMMNTLRDKLPIRITVQSAMPARD